MSEEEKDRPVADSFSLRYHLAPSRGWMNDPNGVVYFKGAYHVFYQFDPNQPYWKLMHWGHYRSTDLVNWEPLPIALYPDQIYDKDGCFSGSAVVDGDELVLIYTGHRWLDDRHEQMKQVQCIARSKDGIHFLKDENNPIIDELPIATTMHVRDPKVWKQDEQWWMVLGNQVDVNGQPYGRLVFYRSPDLKKWEFVATSVDPQQRFGYMWECPDVFRLEQKDAVLLSPQGIEADGDRFRNRFQTGYFQGEWDEEIGQFRIDGFDELDAGHDFYAAQTMLAPDGRRLLWAWMDMWENPNVTAESGWAGALTIPRELFWSTHGKLCMRPAKELLQLREPRVWKWHDIHALQLKNRPLKSRGDCLEFVASLQGRNIGQALNSGAETHQLRNLHGPPEWTIWFRATEDGQEKTQLRMVPIPSSDQLLIELDRTNSGQGAKEVRRAMIPMDSSGVIQLRVFLDRSSIEVFVNDGDATFTSRIYPSANSDRIFVSCSQDDALIHGMSVYPLKQVIGRMETKEVD